MLIICLKKYQDDDLELHEKNREEYLIPPLFFYSIFYKLVVLLIF